jgi:hypothetical protein
MLSLSRLVLALVLPLAVAGAQVLDVRPVQVAGCTQLLVTTLDPSGLSTTSTLVPPGQQASHAPALGGESGFTEAAPQRFLTRWADVGGATHLLATEEGPHESAAAHALRHAAGLELLLLQFPPAPHTADWWPVFIGAPAAQEGQQVFTASWVGVDGLEHGVITTRKAGETLEKFADRHLKGVTALLAVFPAMPKVGLLELREPLFRRVA